MDLDKDLSEEAQAEQPPQADPQKPIQENGDGLYEEVGDLTKYISLMSQKVGGNATLIDDVYIDLPRSSDQIHEVTRKTEEATQLILDDAEKIIGNHELMSGKLESLKATLFDESLKNTMTVKEDITALSALLRSNKDVMLNLVGTLSFQDPAGQDLKEVETMLQNLQSRLLKLIIAFGKDKGKTGISEVREKEIIKEVEERSKKKSLNQALVDSVLKAYGF